MFMDTRLKDKMRATVYVPIFLLALSLATGAPVSESDDNLYITSDVFDDYFKIYTAQHEIVSLNVPLNAINLGDDSDTDDGDADEDDDETATLFFALADVSPNGNRRDQGLYILKNKRATKLLDNGRDTTAEFGDSKVVYFGAKDGLYYYNISTNTAERYGTIDDSIVQLSKVNGSDLIYILTETKELYKVTEQGTKKVKIDDVTNANEIVLDFENNLFYFADDKQPYVVTADGVKKITGLPKNPKYAKLIRPPFVMDNGVPFVSNDETYYLYPNGTSEKTPVFLRAKPSAYGMDATLIQYYAYNKSIYEYNLLSIILGSALQQVRSYLEDFTADIQSIATRSRSDLRA